MAERTNYLSVTELPLLRAWGDQVRLMFWGTMPYQVGSSLLRPDWRDVDVRLMLDAGYVALHHGVLDVYYLNLSVSLWGQKVTGLPIDFQVQDLHSANIDYPDLRRDPIGIGAEIHQTSRAAHQAGA